MAALLSFLNDILLAVYTLCILQFVRKRYLSEKSSLLCLAAVMGLFVFCKSGSIRDFITQNQREGFLFNYTVLFCLLWGMMTVVIAAFTELTVLSRERRTLIQDLALLNFEKEESKKTAEIPAESSTVTYDSKEIL